MEFEEGLKPESFPGEPGEIPDGRAYFGKEREIAEEYSKHGPYEDHIVETRIPTEEYSRHFQQYEQPHSSTPPGTELAIPRDYIDMLNGYLRLRH
ncbi:MAG: hypothetical protein HC927_02785 [Deltaproteobacteria bacterium]|nr:hypothetical protein [Deltaproteobacteria bacterium]